MDDDIGEIRLIHARGACNDNSYSMCKLSFIYICQRSTVIILAVLITGSGMGIRRVVC